MKTVLAASEKSWRQDQNSSIVKTVDTSVNYLTLDYAALGIATFGGIGYLPIVPATWGSLVAAGIYFLAQRENENLAAWAEAMHLSDSLLESHRLLFCLIFLLVLFLIGSWAATRVEKITEKKDPKIVVIDEVLGQLVTLLLVPGKQGLWSIAIGFFVFRFFDIWKPYPANVFETLPFGLGVMTDDLMAGFYSGLLLSLSTLIYFLAL